MLRIKPILQAANNAMQWIHFSHLVGDQRRWTLPNSLKKSTVYCKHHQSVQHFLTMHNQLTVNCMLHSWLYCSFSYHCQHQVLLLFGIIYASDIISRSYCAHAGYWHDDNVVCMSVRLWCCTLWLNITSHSNCLNKWIGSAPRNFDSTTFNSLHWSHTLKIPASSP